MARRYYIYYKQSGSGNLTVGKPSGYNKFLHNPDVKRMSFELPSDKGASQEAIGKFIQDFQRLNAGKFSISNAVTGTVSQPTPPAPKPPSGTGGTDPSPPSKIVVSGKVEPKKEEKDDNSIIILIGIALAIVFGPKLLKKRKR
ncbi:hypothetical protein [Leptospira alstonii]|uniref:Uncharacterized protein n=2 Tax=Leptospira alstonii TaxID=28452 RepID=M6D1Y9_9LEPT|nr:hypothetical protein [Leptospira alstonii]EMJ96716.1 hypothetical protein LEP1GSC194_4280 [Leptospira alstonii serovar Sichuan str. 79601]EQA78798.1 hypothetical protein LEP1GSC193_1666 [Leptospira alstonii serovar Pingchang str. 80-412]